MKDHTWIQREEYPFRSRFFDLDAGRMHYIDEGEGKPVLMIHGNPTWSFLYRHIIKGLSKTRRCIAVDLLGFGLSDKPFDWSYLPKEHAKNINILIDSLKLKDLTIIGQDWGVPIGLSCALKNPENIEKLVIMNSWMWPVADDPHFRTFSKVLGGPLGRLLIGRFNLFIKVLMKTVFVDKSRFTELVHKHYAIPQKNPRWRRGSQIFLKQIIGSTNWLESLWRQREKIADKETLLIWGMKDAALREKELHQWMKLFKKCKTVKLYNTGHYVQEERGRELVPLIENFLINK